MNRRSTVGFSPCGGAATGQGRCANSATVRCPQDGRGRRHLGARSLQRERGRWRDHGEARRDLISARLERLHQALDVASETGQIPAVRLERVAAVPRHLSSRTQNCDKLERILLLNKEFKYPA